MNGERAKMIHATIESQEVVEPAARPVRFVIAAIAAGAFLGLSIISATVIGVDAVRGPDNVDATFYLLVGGTLLGLLLAAYAAWRLLAPLTSAYRRGALSIVCSFATILLMLVCIPIHQLLGRLGLMFLLGLAALGAGVLVVRARRLGAGP